MASPGIVFGMNSLFAVRHLLPEILSMVRDMGMEATVIAPPGPDEDPALICPGVHFRAVPIEREIALVPDLRSLWKLWRALRTIRPVVTNMSTPKMGFLGGVAAVLAGIPHRIYTLRGLRYETTQGWKRSLLVACEKIACRCAHQVICISRSVRETVVREGIAEPGQVILLGERASEGIRLPEYPCPDPAAESAMRRLLGIPSSGEVIGFVGRLTRDKGVQDLAECVRILEREGRDVHLLLIGDFEAGDPVNQETAVWLRSSPRVHWCGYVPDPSPYYPLMDLFVFPTHREGLGKVLLEAAAAGVPVVSTLTTGVVDVVLDGVTGILAPPADPQALADAARRILDDAELAARMGEAARRLVQEHFDNTVYLSRLGDMLHSLALQPASVRE